mmetsp:Transcript_36342/g.67632  ORF Transcript_36342/g.67632 Transcript_36342/m.67632 type:complete len:287 (-) Transcript_36342:227-1087(-)
MKFIVRLVNPRFLSFNRPLLLACTVGFVTLAGFIAISYYMTGSPDDRLTSRFREHEQPLFSGPASVLERGIHVPTPSECLYVPDDEIRELEDEARAESQKLSLENVEDVWTHTRCTETSCILHAWDVEGNLCSPCLDGAPIPMYDGAKPEHFLPGKPGWRSEFFSYGQCQCPGETPISTSCWTQGGIGVDNPWLVVQLDVNWEKSVYTYTYPNRLAGIGVALGYAAWLEMVVSIVVILLFRMCGVIKMREAVTWGEILQEGKDVEAKLEDLEKQMASKESKQTRSI